MCDPTALISFKKPFYLFHYNRPKSPPLPKIKPINYKEKPAIPIRMNYATKLRNKVIKAFNQRDNESVVDYKAMAKETGKALKKQPEVELRPTKTFQYRYKWIREVPVVSCRFTEHVMTFKKPPFSFERPGIGCGHYRLRNMKIKSPEPEVVETESKEQTVVMPSILV